MALCDMANKMTVKKIFNFKMINGVAMLAPS